MTTTFTYNPEELTEAQRQSILVAKENHDAVIARLRADEDLRMQHYYDCIDDYSWGGPCSKANALAQQRADYELQEQIEAIVRGGFIIRSRKVNILRNKSDNSLAACGTKQGRFGRFFKTYDGNFVSCAKMVSTYEKKGYIPLVQTVTEKKKRIGNWPNGDPRYESLCVLSVTEEVSTEIVYPS